MTRASLDLVQSARLTSLERQAMLDRLDKVDADNPARNRRGTQRLPYRRDQITVRIDHPGGSTTACVVATRNISNGGISFLYHGFLHKGTHIQIVLPCLGGEDIVTGVVQHCALVHRMHHLVGVKFVQKIFPELYLSSAERSVIGSTTRPAIDQLRGTVLQVNATEIELQFLRHFLNGSSAELLIAATLAEAVTIAGTRSIDYAVCHATVDQPLLAMLPALRQAGVHRLIAAAGGTPDATTSRAFIAAGADAVLDAPFDPRLAVSLLASWARNTGAHLSGSPSLL